MRIENKLPQDAFREKEGMSSEEIIKILSNITPEEHKRILDNMWNTPEAKRRTKRDMAYCELLQLENERNKIALDYHGDIIVDGPVSDFEGANYRMSKDPRCIALKERQSQLYQIMRDNSDEGQGPV